jgi:probable F420-dependent oxidoreductase
MKYVATYTNMALRDMTLIRDFAQAMDGAGFDCITVSGHVLSFAEGRYPHENPRRYTGPMYDPFVLFSYLAAITNRIHFRPAVIGLPMWETGQVAKQASELSFMSDGRFELGVALSWNPDEYRALNRDFRTRARRLEEQVTLLRRLFTEPYVTFEGRWHHFDQAGLNYVPPGGIPIWFGSQSADEKILRRIARLSDGWMPLGADLHEALPRLRQYVIEAGRDPSEVGVVGRVSANAESGPADWAARAKEIEALGVSQIAIYLAPQATNIDRYLEIKKVLVDTLG